MKKLALILLVSLCVTAAMAAPRKVTKNAKPKTGVRLTSAYSRSLDMEGAVVESMTKRPIDSLNSLAEDSDSKSKHLYSKPPHFQPENQKTLDKLRYQ